MDENGDPAIPSLRLIAETLDVPVERFFDHDSPLDGDFGTRECLRLYSEIKTSSGRERVLECLREVLNDEAR
ncbi:hypothetical protein EBB05_04350 [Methylobacterium brachiatum]|jgi:hypothetical protein|nr:hypothetical protein EBB05_04350 [Methylobacterium brachiatum]